MLISSVARRWAVALTVLVLGSLTLASLGVSAQERELRDELDDPAAPGWELEQSETGWWEVEGEGLR